VAEWQFLVTKFTMRTDLIVKFFQNPSIPWLPTGVPKVEIWQIFVFFRNLENLGYFLKKEILC
jgi:hypothetical protein